MPDQAPISFEQFEEGLQYWGPRINRMHGALQGGRGMTRSTGGNLRTATAGSKPNTTSSATPRRRRKKAAPSTGAA